MPKPTEKTRKLLLSLLIVFVILLLVFLGGYSGFTKSSTVNILLNDHKFGGRALWKAKLHGDSLIPIIRSRINETLGLSEYNNWILMKYFESINDDTNEYFAKELINNEDLTNKLLGIVLYENINKGGLQSVHIDLLNQVICKTHPLLDKRDGYIQGDLALASRSISKVGVGNHECLTKLNESNRLSPKTRREVIKAIDGLKK